MKTFVFAAALIALTAGSGHAQERAGATYIPDDPAMRAEFRKGFARDCLKAGGGATFCACLEGDYWAARNSYTASQLHAPRVQAVLNRRCLAAYLPGQSSFPAKVAPRAAAATPVAPSPPTQSTIPAAEWPNIWREQVLKAGYVSLRTWDELMKETGRYVRRELFVPTEPTPEGEPARYKVVAQDIGVDGSSTGGSVCTFDTNGASECRNNEGVRYTLKPASVSWFLRIISQSE